MCCNRQRMCFPAAKTNKVVPKTEQWKVRSQTISEMVSRLCSTGGTKKMDKLGQGNPTHKKQANEIGNKSNHW